LTAQIADKFFFENDEYSLIGMSGGDLFLSDECDMQPEMLSTACYSGFYATYEITKVGFYLRKLTIREKNAYYPIIGGVLPKLAYYENINENSDELIWPKEKSIKAQSIVEHHHNLEWLKMNCRVMNATYSEMDLKINFTGQIRLAKDFIDALYVHMGYQKPSSFNTVLDLTFRDGELVEINDRSNDVGKIRGKFKEDYDSVNSLKGVINAFNSNMVLE
jgi:hypothetical protein